MGASNAMAAYQLYAGRVSPLSMQVLGYMALVSRDDDEHPWFGQGHEALAYFALGRAAPAARADYAAVERAITPLLKIGAIESDRRPALRRDGPNTVRYRLRLVQPAALRIDEPPVDNSARDHNGHTSRPTESVSHAPRISEPRPTESVTTPHGKRGTEEPGGTTRSEVEENHLDLESDSPPSTGTPGANNEEMSTDESCCPACRVLLDPGRVCGTRTCANFGARLATVHPLTATA